LENVPWDCKVTDKNALDILKHHPQWNSKTNGGTFSIVKKRYGSDFKLWVVNNHDQVVDDISWVIAVKGSLGLSTGARDRHLFKFTKAARELVRDQITEFKRSVSAPSGYDVDHVGTDFADLLRSWLAQKGVNVTDVGVSWPPGGKATFDDQTLAQDWQRYHKTHAQYQLLPPNEHRRLTSARIRERNDKRG